MALEQAQQPFQKIDQVWLKKGAALAQAFDQAQESH